MIKTVHAQSAASPNTPHRTSYRRLVLATGIVISGIAGLALAAETASVQRNLVDVLRGKSAMYLPPLATAHRGDTFQVIDHENRWLKVQYTPPNGGSPVTGYVLASSLSGSDVAPHNVVTGAVSNQATVTAAAPGLLGSAAQGWATSHSYSTDGINAMQATRDRIGQDPSIWERFKSEGHVGVAQ